MKNGKLFSQVKKNENNENMKNGKLFSQGKKNEKNKWKREEREIIFTRKEERKINKN